MSKVVAFVKENRIFAAGWGNGYALVPPGHPAYGKDYFEVDVSVHGGLTFGEYAKDLDWSEIPEECKDWYVLGFDCQHYGDTLQSWPESAVWAEARQLAEQLNEMDELSE